MRYMVIQTNLNRPMLSVTLTQTIIQSPDRGCETELIYVNTLHIQSCVICDNDCGKYRSAVKYILNDDLEALN